MQKGCATGPHCGFFAPLAPIPAFPPMGKEENRRRWSRPSARNCCVLQAGRAQLARSVQWLWAWVMEFELFAPPFLLLLHWSRS